MSTNNHSETFDRANLLYKAMSVLGWEGTPIEVANKVRQLQRGLPKEDEFAALCLWMGKCSLLHKLDQEQFPSLSKEKYQVPDFIVVFNISGKDVSALVEVKKTKSIKLKPFTGKYYDKLTNYANLLKLPLLIAWHIEALNIWCLFDINRLQKKRTAFHIGFDTAMNNNLLGVLFDDVIIHLKPGNKILVRFLKDPGSEKRDASTGELVQFAGILKEVLCLSTNDQVIDINSPLGQLIESLFRLVENEQGESEDEKYMTLTYYTTQKEDLFAHQLLATMAFGTRIFNHKNLNWLEVLKQNKFRMDYSAIRDTLSVGVRKGAIAAIIQQKPVIHPDFILE